jgi:signal transduction histidine kinase
VGNELSTGNDAASFVGGRSAKRLHPIIKDEFYSMFREALRNAFRHAPAQHVYAEISYAAGRLCARSNGGELDTFLELAANVRGR